MASATPAAKPPPGALCPRHRRYAANTTIIGNITRIRTPGSAFPGRHPGTALVFRGMVETLSRAGRETPEQRIYREADDGEDRDFAKRIETAKIDDYHVHDIKPAAIR